MYKIIRKNQLNNQMTLMKIFAPDVAQKAQAGQFIILRVNEEGERIPLTISDYNPQEGTITIIFQIIGKTTSLLNTLEEGDCIQDFAGPLGNPSELDGYKNVAVIGGGLGVAISYPIAKALYNKGCNVHSIMGFRNKDLVILENELVEVSQKLEIATDDGSNGNKGFVTNMLEKLINEGNNYDLVVAIGPLPMMKAVCNLTAVYGIKTVVSMNTIMIDGTGMCGCCRVTVDGKTRFACVDGPEFDGHKVDFDSAIRRANAYKTEEQIAKEKFRCRLTGGDGNHD